MRTELLPCQVSYLFLCIDHLSYNLHSLALFKEIGNFWRQNKSAPIIPLVKVYQRYRRLLWKIFMNKMARFWEYLEVVFACVLLVMLLYTWIGE